MLTRTLPSCYSTPPPSHHRYRNRNLPPVLVIGIFLPLLVFILSSPNVVDVSGYSNAPTLGDELDKFTATNQTISPHHDMPIGALKIALPQYCPVAFQALPNTLLLDPCILELSRRIVQAIIEDQAGKPDDLATDAPLLTNTEAILSLVPEATHYFTFRSKHLDPRTWSVALIHLRTTCNAIVDAHQYYSVVNKTIVTSGDSVQFPGTPSDPHYFYSRTTVPPIELTRSTGGLPHLLYGIQPVVESNDYDVYCLASMNSDLRDLALGWFLMRNTTYAHRAIHQLNTWFINPVSFMQPSSQYAGISTEPNDLDPLKNTLLKFLPLIEIIDSIGLLQDSEYYTWQIARGLKVWFETYLDHLLTSDLGHATARRTDFIANYYMAQIISIASFVGQLPLVREAIELSLANQEDELGKNGVILAAVLMEDATERWTYVTNTLQAHVTIGLQAQHATDIRRMIRPNAYAPTNNLVDDGATTSFGVGSKRRSQSLPSDSDPWIASASVSAAAAASLTIAASLLPPTDRWIFLPDCILYLTDTAYLLHSESISTALEGLHHDEQLTIRAWTQSITLEAIATSNPSLPPMAHRYATVLWQFASIWESPWYQWRSARGASRCLVDINYALPYQCYTLMADRLGPLVRSSPNGWITLGAFAPVRVLPGDVYTETHSVGLFPGVAIFDTNSLPFFLSLGIFGLLRWASFLFRIVPAAFWLCRERRRPKYFKSLRLRAERAVTIIVPTIDSGPELKAAIISWLRNRPKRIIFSTIHKEKAAIVSLLQSCVDMWEEILVRERDQLRTERRAFDVEDDSDLEDDGFRTEVSVLSVGHPNKRQQMVAALTHLDTEIVVFADDDAIWPATCLERTLACFDNTEIGGVVTEQRMRPVPKNQNGASWLRIADATVWEIIADFRLTAKLLENAAACWFGPSLSCLSGRTAAYRSCILKPTVYAGPCNPYANRFFEADKFGFRPEDYAKPTEIADRLQRQLHRTDVFHDALSAVTIQQLVTSHNMRQLVIPVKKETRSATSFTEKKDPSGSGIRTSESNRSNSPHHTSRSEPERQPSPLSPQPRNQPTALNLTAIVAAMESHAETVPSSPVSSIVLARDADRVSVPPTRPNSPVAQLEQEHTYGASNSTAPSLTTSIESTVPPIVSGESATVSSTAIASTVPSSSDEFPPDEHAVSTLPLGDVKKHSTFDIDRVTDSSELLLKLSADGDTKEPSGINSQNLPLMFYSFCIHFCNDYFVQPWAASHLHSGDDKFLTRYLICRGWLLYMQVGEDVAIETTFKPNWNFLKQYMRWTRNTWRSDFRAILKERMVWYSTRYWFLIYLMFDKCIAPFTLIFGPILVIWICAHSSVGLYATMGEPDRNYRLPLWNIVVSYVIWICVMRSLRILPHFIRKPAHLLAMPFYVSLQYLLAVLKIYALFTLHVTDWGTRQVDDADNEADAINTLGADQMKAQQMARSKIKRRTI